MEWSALYGPDNKPSPEQIKDFIQSPLWPELLSFLQDTYRIKPALAYSKCSMQKGWNIKFRKSGKSLCTLYPMPGYFTALVVIGAKEAPEADLLIPACSPSLQKLYRNTPFSAGGKWLMINVTGSSLLTDVKNLIKTRMDCK